MGHVLIAEKKLVKDEDREGFYIIPGFESYSIKQDFTTLYKKLLSSLLVIVG